MENGITYSVLRKINDSLPKTNIKGKDYVDVASKIQGFRQIYPDGGIETEVIRFEGGTILIKATVKAPDGRILGMGHAFENQNASMINKTSFVENCETSAIGRALSSMGIGSTQSIASVEELTSAMAAQEVISQTEKVIDSIIDIAGGDRERVNTYVRNLFPGNNLEDLDYQTLVRLKMDIAKKMAVQQEGVSNFNIQRRNKS